MWRSHYKKMWKQECIPVGCVPATRRPYAGVCFLVGGGAVCLFRGEGGGGCLPGPGGCLPGPGGVSAWSRGRSAWSGGDLPGPGGGVCLVRGGSGIPACTEADTLPPTPCGQTDTCKNITLATTLFGRK